MFSMFGSPTPPIYCIPPAEEKICRLPTEVFAQCLTLACQAKHRHQVPPTAWTLSLVCRDWRMVLADCPKLWTETPLLSPRVLQGRGQRPLLQPLRLISLPPLAPCTAYESFA
ncbi:hypothetical protein OF83DRAFT_563032 [Amylostereum chailletii]|nr:hypothetical protein OF83DRAFT_563032 [Amylostereum chailletii]